MYGQGSFFTTQNAPPAAAPGPPFPLNSADNGLSVDTITGRIVLGDDSPSGPGDPGIFLSNRSLNLGGFNLDVSDNSNPFLTIDPANGLVTLADSTGVYGGGALTFDYTNKAAVLRADNGNAMALTLDAINLQAELGDLAGSGFGTRFRINDAARTVDIRDGAAVRMLDFDRIADSYQIGDIDLFGNGSKLFIDNGNRTIKLQTSFGEMLLLDQAGAQYEFGDLSPFANGNKINIDDSQQQTTVKSSTKTGLFIDLNTGQYTIGDQAGGTNGTRLDILDNSMLAEIKTNAGGMAEFDQVNGVYRFGDLAGVAAVNFIRVSSGPNQIVNRLNGNDYLALNATAGIFAFGDLDAGLNGGKIELDDTNNVLNILNTANTLGININGVAGFTGTVAAPATITVNNGIVTNVA